MRSAIGAGRARITLLLLTESLLAPGGYVRIEDRRYEAFCRSGHAAVGARLKVVGLDNFRLIVSKT